MMLRDPRQPRISPDFVARIDTSHFLSRQIIVTGELSARLQQRQRELLARDSRLGGFNEQQIVSFKLAQD